MKPSRCGGYIRIHGTTPASEERYEHLSIGCIAMDDGTGTFGVAVAPDVSFYSPNFPMKKNWQNLLSFSLPYADSQLILCAMLS